MITQQLVAIFYRSLTAVEGLHEADLDVDSISIPAAPGRDSRLRYFGSEIGVLHAHAFPPLHKSGAGVSIASFKACRAGNSAVRHRGIPCRDWMRTQHVVRSNGAIEAVKSSQTLVQKPLGVARPSLVARCPEHSLRFVAACEHRRR